MAYFHTTVLDEQIKALPTVATAQGSVASFETDLTENLISCVCDISSASTVNVILGRPTTLLEGCNINTSGTIISAVRYNLVIMPITQGKTYTMYADNIVYAFYNDMPVLGSIAYDNTRVTGGSGSFTFTAPITGYIALRYDITTNEEAYSGIKYTVNLGNTYTGVVDVITGKIKHGTPEQIDYADNSVEIPTLSGNNVVYSDSGDTTVKYLLTVGKAIS